MIKTITTILIIAAVAGVGWGIWRLWEKLGADNSASQQEQQQQTLVNSVVPEQLSGMPQAWEAAFKKATNNGTASFRAWMKQYGQQVEDPRRAWIELDYMVRVSTEDPQEAKAIFELVKERTPTNSPVYPRIQQLEKTYE